jgi:hypothetical protein
VLADTLFRFVPWISRKAQYFFDDGRDFHREAHPSESDAGDETALG